MTAKLKASRLASRSLCSLICCFYLILTGETFPIALKELNSFNISLTYSNVVYISLFVDLMLALFLKFCTVLLVLLLSEVGALNQVKRCTRSETFLRRNLQGISFFFFFYANKCKSYP